MKKIVILLVFSLFGNLVFSQTENYIYNPNGTKIYFQNNSNVKYFKFINVLTVVQKQEFLATLSAKSATYEEIATDLFKINVPQNSTSTMQILNNKEIVEFCSSEMLYTQDSTIQWAGSHIFVHPKENHSLVSLLNSLNVSYSDIDTISPYLPNQYSVKIIGENAVDCANRLFESGKFIYSQPAFYRANVLYNAYYSQQWGLKNTGQLGGTIGIDINVEPAWNITNGNPNIKVAVIDNGIDLDHVDLAENILSGYDALELGSNGGYSGNDNHGTACAGIIAAADNSIGIKGIANKCKIIPVRMFSGNTFSYDQRCVNSVIYAIENNASVLSCSWGGGSDFTPLTNAINTAATQGRNGKGCVVVFASGNGWSSTVSYPANLSNVIAVGSINRYGIRAGFSNYGDALDVVAPGVEIATTNTNNGYTQTFTGTSAACPHVAGVAALMLSVNPNLTSTQVKNIIEQTAQEIGNYSYNNSSAHPNGTWNDQMGYGLVDAYAAVNAALDVDLYTRDKESDNGTEPNTGSLTSVLNSPDIWLRRSADNGTEHQIGHNGGVNHVYIRINNKGVTSSLGNDTVELYAKKAGNGEYSWNSGWTKVGTACIPSIPAGGSTTVRISATFPNYNRFPITWDSPNMYYALLTRIKSDLDPMTFTEGTSAPENAYNNNNISYKNVTTSSAVILDDDVVTDVVVAAFDNPTNGLFRTTLKFTSPSNEVGDPLFEEAEIRLVFPKTLVQSWGSSYTLSGAKKINDSTFLITGSSAKMENISIPANYEGYMMAKVNFLTEEYSEKDKYEYIVEQTDPTTGEYQNGLVMIVDKTLRSNLFAAEGGENIIANANVPVNLSATAIGEDAVYNWYDASGVLVNSGQNIAVTSSQTQKYTLEVTAKADGYKDYDSVYVIRTLGNIVSISPNPASGQAVVTYNLASSVSSASIVVTNSSGLPVYNSAINVSATTHTLNLQNLVAGQYSLRLVSSTGEVLDTKTLIVQ